LLRSYTSQWMRRPVGHSLSGLVGGAQNCIFLQTAAITLVTGSGSHNPEVAVDTAVIHVMTGAVTGAIAMYKKGSACADFTDALDRHGHCQFDYRCQQGRFTKFRRLAGDIGPLINLLGDKSVYRRNGGAWGRFHFNEVVNSNTTRVLHRLAT